MTNYYALAHSPLGHLLVMGTAQGVTRVSLADDATALTILARQHAAIPDADDQLTPVVAALMATLSGADVSPMLQALPLDLTAGTAFQREVWALIQQIPYGSTQTYGDLAHQLGDLGAVRAVAQACGANPVPVLIPCHRVVGSNGELGGYNLGVARKRHLLTMEGGITQPRLFE